MNLLQEFIRDLKAELAEEFDRNFERKGFFNKRWPDTRMPNRRGSLLMRSGALRRSIRSEVAGNALRFFSSLPYASIHNEGGYITVTVNMKKYFWAMHLKAKGGKKSKSMSAEADFFKAMALKPTGSRIKIEQRQFIGYHPDMDRVVDRVFKETLNKFETEIQRRLKS